MEYFVRIYTFIRYYLFSTLRRLLSFQYLSLLSASGGHNGMTSLVAVSRNWSVLVRVVAVVDRARTLTASQHGCRSISVRRSSARVTGFYATLMSKIRRLNWSRCACVVLSCTTNFCLVIIKWGHSQSIWCLRDMYVTNRN